ncbi:MAG: PDZ domain-containing protein [SAR324 cluster bacterium]|nr:PDZ domain-containing protein [SAR324 cluster bacterium]
MHHFIIIVFILVFTISCQVSIPETEKAEDITTKKDSSAELYKTKPFLGIGYETVEFRKDSASSPEKGIRVIKTLHGTAAEKAGIKPGDIILQYDQQALHQSPKDKITQQFKSYITQKKKIGDPLRLKIFRIETLMTGERDAKKIPDKELSPDTISELIETQKPGETLKLGIIKQPAIRKFTPRLGTKPYRLSQAPPRNSELLPKYENYTAPYIELSKKLMSRFELEGAYQDLLERYDNDEWWDDGFRLKVFRYIHRDPLKLPKIAEDLVNDLEATLHGQIPSFPKLIAAAANIIDASGIPDNIPTVPKTNELDDHLSYIVEIVEIAHGLRNEAFDQLSKKEIDFLYEYLPAVTDKFAQHYYLDYQTSTPLLKKMLKVLRLSHRVNFTALLQSGYVLNHLADKEWLNTLTHVLRSKDWNTPPGDTSKLSGDIKLVQATKAGKLIIGGPGATQYQRDAAIIIDIGGNDFYANNAGSARNKNTPIAVLIDLEGHDTYSATSSLAQGSGMLGSGILIDVSGHDVYTGTQLAQGSSLMGTGTLIDLEGDDRYHGQEYNQGFGLWGSGLLVDLRGNDSYSSHLFAQGVGAPKGIGLLLDNEGNDQYYATGKHKSTYHVEGIFHGSSQGYGIGFREYASGGVGILLDSNGSDRFQAGNFSQGGGYFFGLGILKNSGQEPDYYIGSRYSQGFSAHSAAGVLIDDGGNDHYIGKIGAMQGAAWDLGSAVLIDYSGNDTYDTMNWGFAQPAANHNGFSLLVDLEGSDTYLSHGRTHAKNEYHGGHSFAFFIDSGGASDQYMEAGRHNTQITLEGQFDIFADLDQSIESSLEDNALETLIAPKE